MAHDQPPVEHLAYRDRLARVRGRGQLQRGEHAGQLLAIETYEPDPQEILAKLYPDAEILAIDIGEALAPFDLKNQLSSNRTQGVPNMIALIRETAQRLAA